MTQEVVFSPNTIKKQRLVVHDGYGDKVALQMLLGATAWDAMEFLKSLGLELKEGKDYGVDTLSRLRMYVSDSSLEISSRRVVADTVIETVKTLSAELKSLQGLENLPPYPDVSSALQELETEKASQGRRLIQIYCNICRKHLVGLRELDKVNTQSMDIVGRCETLIQVQMENMKRMAVVEESNRNARERDLTSCIHEITKLDQKILQLITKGLTETCNDQSDLRLVTLCLDAVGTPTPQMSGYMAERKTLHDRLNACKNGDAAAMKRVDMTSTCKMFLDTIVGPLTAQAKDSGERATRYNSRIYGESGKALLEYIPLLTSELKCFYELQKDRTNDLDKKTRLKKLEMAEHMRLYGDEAPCELKDIKKRLHEYERVQDISRSNLALVAQSQSDLWKLIYVAKQASAGTTTPFHKNGLERLTVLPKVTEHKLLRHLTELVLDLEMPPECILRKALYDILSKFPDVQSLLDKDLIRQVESATRKNEASYVLNQQIQLTSKQDLSSNDDVVNRHVVKVKPEVVRVKQEPELNFKNDQIEKDDDTSTCCIA